MHVMIPSPPSHGRSPVPGAGPTTGFQARDGAPPGAGRRGFTLLELLVVLGIIGLMAGISLPALRGLGQANVQAAANRQLLDDLSYARMRAIQGRTTVYVVFAPVNPFPLLANLTTDGQRRQMSNLFGGRYTSYALLAKRTVGDQPGREFPRYLTDWRRLPEGVFFATNKFVYLDPQQWLKQTNHLTRPFAYLPLPLPTANSPAVPVPYLAFNAQGQLESLGRDEVIPLARGSIFYQKDAQGSYVAAAADVREVPPGNSSATPNYIQINWLTGRARAVKPEVQ